MAGFEDNGILIDFIMLYETLLFDPLPGYKIVCNNMRQRQRGGVAKYSRDIFQHKLHDDLTMNYNNEFESIFIEIDDNMHKELIGEIYRVSGTSAQLPIQRYMSILQITSGFNENHGQTRNLLDSFISSGFIPTITKPTRITHTASTLIDNLQYKSRLSS